AVLDDGSSLGPPDARLPSTLTCTSSAASSENRSTFPSAYRYSIAMFLPSMYPRSRRACLIDSERLASLPGSDGDRYPISGIFFGCCASADMQSAKSKVQRVSTVIFFFIRFFSLAPLLI